MRLIDLTLLMSWKRDTKTNQKLVLETMLQQISLIQTTTVTKSDNNVIYASLLWEIQGRG